MSQKRLSNGSGLAVTAAVCLVLSALCYAYFVSPMNTMEIFALFAGALIVLLLVTRDLTRLSASAACLLLGYVVFTGLTALWAMAGKFFLREYMKIFVAVLPFLFILLREAFDARFARKIEAMIAGSAALYALLSVEGASTGLVAALLKTIPGAAELEIGFNARLYGIFGNSNVEASLYAFGIFFSVALLCDVKEKKERVLCAVMLFFNAYAFVLVFSMGAIACFAVAIACYLIFAGRERGATLLHMLIGAIPALLLVFVAFRCFGKSGFAGLLPMLLMLAGGAVTAALELLTADRLTAVFNAHSKLTTGFLISILALAVVYVLAAYNLSAPYTFGGAVERAIRPTAGEHTLMIDADGPVSVEIYSQNTTESMMYTRNYIYKGSADGAQFTVPEDSIALYFNFSADEGTTLRAASVDGAKKIPLRYPLLPAFAANRIQALWASDTAMQRIVFFGDGMKLWRLSPIVGLGVGAFETGVSRVQQFHYETRYVHNHYIQILLEDGVIGLALWVAALAAMAVTLWKRRKEPVEWEYRRVYPALWAGLVMLITQTITDISLSFPIFLVYAYALFGLIVRTCAQRKSEPEAADDASRKAKKAAQERKQDTVLLLRIVGVMLPAAFMLTLVGNLWADKLGEKPASSADEHFANLDLAVKVDAYEYNDAKLSYIVGAMNESPQLHLVSADAYAKELAQVQSNSIPTYLVLYYLNTQQYEAAIDEAMQAARLSASNPAAWNNTIDLLVQMFTDNPGSPLLTDADALLPKLLAYRDMYYERNATALEEIELTPANAAFFDLLDEVAANKDDTAALWMLLNPGL